MTGPAGPAPDARALAAALGLPVEVHETVASTMIVAREDPGPAPRLHLAARQTAGRGRRGRGWESPAGNLYATLAWPDPARVWPAAVLAAVQLAWADTLAAAGVEAARVKWPNDGWIHGRKWSGTVAERAGGPEGERLLLGLGANLVAVPEGLPAGSATALAEHWRPWPGSDAVTRRLLRAALDVLRDGPDALPARLAGWASRDAFIPGQDLRLDGPEGGEEGRYGGILPDGRLRFHSERGERWIAAGEISLRAPDVRP